MGVETLLINLAISVVVSAASYELGKLLAPKKKRTVATVGATASAPDPMNDYQGVGGPLPGIFGHRRVAGKQLVQVKSGNATYIIYVIAGAPVAGIEGVYIDNALVTINGSGDVTSEPWANGGEYSMKCWFYTGTQTTVDATLDSVFENWTSEFVGKQIAYAIVKIDPSVDSVKFENTYSGGIPDFSFHIRGFKCYDPRDGGCVLGNEATYIFSVNPSIIEANYLIHKLGMNLETSRVDWDSVEASADIDDAVVSLANGGTERRYTACLYWTTDEQHERVLERIGAAHAGGVRPIGKKWVMMGGTFPSSTATVVPDDYAGSGLTITEKVPLSGRHNGVRGQFVSPSDNYEKRDFPSYQSATALAEDDGREEWLELDLDCVTSHTQAQRLARIAYNRVRLGYQASLTVKFKHFDIVADDVITITDELAGLSGATFRVQDESLGDGYEIELDLTYETAAMFAWTAATDEQEYESSAPIGGEFGQVRPPGIALIDSTAPGGAITPNVVIWPSPSVFESAFQYRYLQSSTSRWTGALTSTQSASGTTVNAVAGIGQHHLDIEDSLGNQLVRSTIDATGNAYGTMIDVTALTTPYYTLPAAPAPLLLSLSSGSAQIFIRDVTDCQRAQNIRIYKNSTNDFATSSLVSSQAVSASGNTFTVTGTPGEVAFFWARIQNATDSKDGYESKPLLIVF